MFNNLLSTSMGYESYLSYPIISMLTGIILFFGVAFLGNLIIKYLFKKNDTKNNLYFLNSSLIGSNALIILLFPIASFGFLNKNFLLSISYLILLLGFFSLKNVLKIKYKYLIKFKLLSLLLLLFFLLALSPVTHADSIAYHLNSAVNLIETGSFSGSLLPMEIKTEGAGELLIAIGLVVGSEQFGNLVQYGGLLSIIASFNNKTNNNYFLLLSVITVPCFIFLLSSPKPQLMQIANTLFVFSYLVSIKNIKNKLKNFIILSTLLTINFLSKFSFILSSLFLSVLLFKKLVTKKNIFKIIISIFLVTSLLILPNFYFKYVNFSISLMDYISSSIPININGYDNLNLSLKKISDGSRFFPIWIIFTDRLAGIGSIVGPIFLSFLLFNYRNKLNLYLLFIFLFYLLILIFGQATSRFIFEGFVLMQFLLTYYNFRSNNLKNFFEFFVKIQVFGCVIILLYLIINLTPGSINNDLRNKVMLNNANGYELMKWVNKNTNESDVIFSSHRSLSLIKNESYFLVYLNYINFELESAKKLINFIKTKKNAKLLITSNVEKSKFEKCKGELIIYKKNAGRNVGRTPFKGEYYDAYLYDFDLSNFPKCLF